MKQQLEGALDVENQPQAVNQVLKFVYNNYKVEGTVKQDENIDPIKLKNSQDRQQSLSLSVSG